MENQVVRRRVNTIASHIATHEDISATATHLLPMSCSTSLNSVIRRCDNRMYFARQASSSQACFMRQTTNVVQGRCPQSTISSKCTAYANTRLCTSEAPMFSRPTRIEPSWQNVGAEAPMFSRPTGVESSLQHVGQIQSLLKGSNYPQLAPYPEIGPEASSFARPSRTDLQCQYKKRNFDSVPRDTGFEWSPKMDVAESGSAYVITIELPGISVSSIRLAVSNQKLMVTGTRSIQWCKVSAYHKKEISQGPYRIVWPLPTNVDKDNISAEFVDGLLQITIPKVSAVRKPLKAYI